MRGRRVGGFTLIELMIVVAIIGVLAAVALPAFMKYVRKAKSTEAIVGINKLYEGSRAYIVEPTHTKGGGVAVNQFPDTEALTPAATCCGNAGDKCPATPALWETPTWAALRFDMHTKHYYQFEYESTGSAAPGPGSQFTARAMGDLDCDGVFSTFEMYGVWESDNRDVKGSAGIFKNNEVE